MITILIVSGSATGQDVTDQIPACTDNEITITATVLSNQLAVFNEILVVIGEADNSKLPDLITNTEVLQNQWWNTDFESIPQCGFAVQIVSQYGHALDELLITLLFVDANMNAQANSHYATSINLKNDVEAIVSDLPTAQAESAPVQGVNVTAINQVNLRGGPGTNYPVAGTLSANQTTTAIARSSAGDWLVLESGAWVAAWVVTVEGDVNTLPVRQAPPVPDAPPPQPQNTPVPQSTLPPSQPTVPPAPTESPAPGYTCDCSKTCSQMTCEEAYFQLNQCGCSARDGDGDGVPCESICPGG